MPDIFVIGAGVAGIGAALELANRGYNVTIIEQDTLGYGSSGRNPGRMGHGYHYLDHDTAIMYLRASIQVQRQFPGYLVGQDKPFDAPIRHGRYFITKNSDNSPDEILNTYRKIQEEYKRLINEDPQNEVFGPPDKFFRILNPKEYERFVNPEIVEIGIETAEHLFNWKKFAEDIKKAIVAHSNINLLENTEVIRMERGNPNQKEKRFTLHTKTQSGETRFFSADFVINSTWQNIEKLNNEIGIRMIPGARTNRLKCLLIVKLPNSLVNANSMFFCMGQHCMFSNMGNGYGMMTFAKVTNMEASSDLNLSAECQRLLANKATDEEKSKIAKQMLEGVSKYIPEMAKAEIIEVKYGIVQTSGQLKLEDLSNPSSSFHKRDYDGVRSEQIGLISNPCVKLFYFLRNGQVVSDILESQLIVSKLIDIVTEDIKQKSIHGNLPLHSEVLRSIRGNLDLYTSLSSFPPIPSTLFLNFIGSNTVKSAAIILVASGLAMSLLALANLYLPITIGAVVTGLGTSSYLGNFFAQKELKTPVSREPITSNYSLSLFKTISLKKEVVKDLHVKFLQAPVL